MPEESVQFVYICVPIIFSSLNHKPQIKILLVDDREDNLLSIEAILERHEYVFTKANSGRQALKVLLKEQDFTLILMDVQMPDLNGFETAALIYERDKLKHIPIIFITAHDYGDENVYKGYQTGAVDYIYKPINPELLRAKVSVFVDLHRKTHLLLIQEQKLIAVNNELEARVKQRTKELETANGELKRINADLDSFVYATSHDLRSPLASLDGLFHVLTKKLEGDGKLDEKENQMLDMIQGSLGKFRRTLDDLTKVIRVQKDLEEEKMIVSFHEVLEDVKTDIAPLISESQAQITTNFQVPEISYARKNIRSILYNLLSNAIKYRSPERPVHVILTTRGLSGNTAVLTVSDNGLGIRSDQTHKLFTMFKRLHNHVEGSGIGLYMIKKIVENNSGTIEVTSELDKGTTFTVLFRNL